DMYPLYWTTSKGGIFMRYSYEFKRKAIELFYQGKWPKTPAGVSTHTFHRQIRDWVKLERLHGSDINKCQGTNKYWSPKEKYELVCQVLSGQGLRSVAIVAGINSGQLYQWVHKYKTLGYNGLINKRKGRPPKDCKMKVPKTISPRKLKESEYEELIRLRAENAYIKAENEVIKKEIALREEKEAARLKAKKQRSSKCSANKAIN
ncbi:MAG: helix-turn-helix domain-containing protein, partial [Veillonella sp.]|nr:helix-turn-helix domain-containing protein [Veillonella sp.]